MNNLIKEYSEYISNLSKKRKFPTFGDTKRNLNRNLHKHSDVYYIYSLSKKDIGKYLNTWFSGEILKDKDGNILRDEMWTVKKVDEETAGFLYRRKINPISLTIMCPTGKAFRRDENGIIINYQMKAHLFSIDDSSFGIWFENNLEELEKIRYKLMNWINAKDEINGEEFLNICVDLGADEDSKDYN